MRAGIASAITLLGLLGAAHAVAAEGDGNELITQCTDTLKAVEGGKVDNYFGVGYCLGVTQGVRQTLAIQNEGLPAVDRTCIPEGMTNGQGVRIVLKFLQDHPADLQKPAVFLVYRAYRAAYPCS